MTLMSHVHIHQRSDGRTETSVSCLRIKGHVLLTSSSHLPGERVSWVFFFLSRLSKPIYLSPPASSSLSPIQCNIDEEHCGLY